MIWGGMQFSPLNRIEFICANLSHIVVQSKFGNVWDKFGVRFQEIFFRTLPIRFVRELLINKPQLCSRVVDDIGPATGPNRDVLFGIIVDLPLWPTSLVCFFLCKRVQIV